MVLVDGLQPHEHALELVEITPELHGIINDGANRSRRVDEENRPHGRRSGDPGLNHAVFAGHLHRHVGDEREIELDALVPLELDALVDGTQPGDVAGVGADREPDQPAVERLELRLHGTEHHELRRTDGGEIRRMAEQDDPLALEILRKTDFALRGLGLERRGLVADQRHHVGLIVHSLKI